MKKDDLLRFAADLCEVAGLAATAVPSDRLDGMHVLKIAGVDFYFYTDGSGYDGWGKGLIDWKAKP